MGTIPMEAQKKERKIADEIDGLEKWAAGFNMNDLHMALLASLE